MFADLFTAQQELDAWVASYDHERPHQFKDMRTPADVFTTSKAALFVNNAAGEGFAAGNNPVQATWPWTWSNGDQVVVNFDYEAAAAS